MPEFQPIAALSSVREGQGITVFVGSRNVALFNINGEIFALDGVCPHKGAPLGHGHCEDGKVFCPMHGWSFAIRTGQCLDFPDRAAQKLDVRIAGEMIEVAL